MKVFKFLNSRMKKICALVLVAALLVAMSCTLAFFTDRISHKMTFTTATFAQDGYALETTRADGPFVAGESFPVTLSESNEKDEDIESYINMTIRWDSPDSSISIFGNADESDNASISLGDGTVIDSSSVQDFTVSNDKKSVTFTLPKQALEAGAEDVSRVLTVAVPESFVSTGDISIAYNKVTLKQTPVGFSYEITNDDLNRDPVNALDFTVKVGWAASSRTDSFSTPNGHKALMGYLTEKDANDLYGIEFSLEFNYPDSAMKNFASRTDAKWSHYKNSTNKLTFVDGMTTIGDYAFPDFSKVTSVSFPGTVATIGLSAFDNAGLTDEVTIPATVSEIMSLAFANLELVDTFTFGHTNSNDLELPDNISDGKTTSGAFYLTPEQYVNTTVNTSVEEIKYGYSWHTDNRRPIPTLAAQQTWFEASSGTYSTEDIEHVTFKDWYVSSGNLLESWDASSEGDGSVMAYLEEGAGGELNLIIAGNGYGSILTNEDSTGAFQEFRNVQDYTGIELLDTSNTTNMTNMFLDNGTLTSLDLTTFDVSNVTHFNYMFCMESSGSSLTSLDVSNWDTSAATHTAGMFVNLYKLTDLDVSKWNTSNLIDANYMFHGCTKVETLDIARKEVNNGEYTAWDTSKLENASYMFEYMQSVKELDISEWNLSAATNTNNMLSHCEALESLTIPASLTTFGADFASFCQSADTITFLHGKDTALNLPTAGYYSAFYIENNLETVIVAENTEAINYNWKADNRAKTPAALLFSDGTMIFQIGNTPTYTGADLVATYKNFDTTTYSSSKLPPWKDNMESIENVIIQDDMSVTGTGYWFYGATNLESFSGSGSLTLNNTFAVKNTFSRYMFYDCSSLTSLDLSLLDTSKVTDMSGMLQNCSALTSIDLSSMNTSAATKMTDMFAGMNKLAEVTVGANFSFTGSGSASGTLPAPSSEYITGADGKWYNVESDVGYAPADVPSNTVATYTAISPVKVFAVFSETDGSLTFYNRAGMPSAGSTYNGKAATAVYTGFDTATYTSENKVPWTADRNLVGNITNVSFVDKIKPVSTAYWFSGRSSYQESYETPTSITAINNLNNLDTSNVTNMAHMFYRCDNLTQLDVSSFDTSLVTNMRGMFYHCSSLQSLDVSNFDTSNVNDMYYMFFRCSSLQSLDVSSFDTSSVTVMFGMFTACSGLTSLDVSNFDTSNVTIMGSMFNGCSGLTSLDLSSFNTSQVTNMSTMFYRCSSLQSLDLSSFNTSSVTSMYYMFDGCSVLNTIYASALWNTNAVTESDSMFTGCTNLVGGNGTAFATAGVEDHTYARIDKAGTPGYFTDIADCEAFAVFSETDASLTFYKRPGMPAAGSTYKGKAATSVYTGFETATYTSVSQAPWYSNRTSTRSVTFADKIAPVSTAYWFCQTGITSFDGSNLDTSNVTDMRSMFYVCSSLTSLDVSNFNTSNVTNMTDMFQQCSSLTSLDVSNFDTSKVTSMDDMFFSCNKLTSLDVSNFDTSKVTSMGSMFNGCKKLTSLDVSNFNTSNVTNMSGMFSGCTGLTSLDVSNFDTSNVTNMSSMFNYCSSLTSRDVSNFDTSNVTNMSGMFGYCSGLTSLDVSNFDTSKVTSMWFMFRGCSSLTSLDLSNFDTSNVTGMIEMFNGCSVLNTIYVSDLWTTDAITLNSFHRNMFTGCTNLVGGNGTAVATKQVYDKTYAKIDKAGQEGYLTDIRDTYTAFAVFCETDGSLTFYKNGDAVPAAGSPYNGKAATAVYTGFETATYSSNSQVPWYSNRTGITSVTFADKIAPVSTAHWFNGASSLSTFNGTNLNTANVTDMSSMFSTCVSLTSLDLSGFNTSSVTDMSSMFSNCGSLTSLDVSNFDTSKVTGMWYMFRGCSSLTSLDLSNFNTSNVTDMSYMFYYCRGLTSLDVSNFDTSNVINMDSMFSDCDSLTSLDVSNFNTSLAERMASMFYDCVSLTSLDLSSFNTSSVITMDSMFGYCSGLTSLDLSSFNTGNVITTERMFRNCSSLTSLDLSSFNTENVTYMGYMFRNCSGLTSIYVSDLWTTNSVTSHGNMFTGCTNLVGGNGTAVATKQVYDKTYAKIDKAGQEGYLTDINNPPAFAVYSADDGSLTFYKRGGMPSAGSTYNGKAATAVYTGFETATYTSDSQVPWYSNRTGITKVTFADEIAPVSTRHWFNGALNLSTFNGTNLDTSNVTNMSYMFSDCESLTSLDVSNFDTSNVTRMDGMFRNCSGLTSLDLSSFDTSSITNMNDMFGECYNLKTIYASDLWSTTWQGEIFHNCYNLIGGNGTAWSKSNLGSNYARIDGKDGLPGYFTGKAAPAAASILSLDFENGAIGTYSIK